MRVRQRQRRRTSDASGVIGIELAQRLVPEYPHLQSRIEPQVEPLRVYLPSARTATVAQSRIQ